jgi:hypothetical protein
MGCSGTCIGTCFGTNTGSGISIPVSLNKISRPVPFFEDDDIHRYFIPIYESIEEKYRPILEYYESLSGFTK